MVSSEREILPEKVRQRTLIHLIQSPTLKKRSSVSSKLSILVYTFMCSSGETSSKSCRNVKSVPSLPPVTVFSSHVQSLTALIPFTPPAVLNPLNPGGFSTDASGIPASPRLRCKQALTAAQCLVCVLSLTCHQVEHQ